MSNPDQTPESDNNGIARQQELDREQAANISRRSLLLGLGVTLGTGIAASSSATATAQHEHAARRQRRRPVVGWWCDGG